jgi:hypothetical protein
MRNTLQVFTGIILLLSLLITSCTDYDLFEPYGDLDRRFVYLNELQPEAMVAKIDPTTAHTIITADTVLMEIPANAFIDQYGQDYRGEVQLNFALLESRQHLLAYGLSLVEKGGQLIEPMAVIKMNAFTLSGDVLKINPGKSLRIKYPKTPDLELPLVFAEDSENHAESIHSWERIQSSDYHNKVYQESWTWKSEDGEIRHSEGLILHTNIPDWILLGYAVDNPFSMQLDAYLPEHFQDDDFRVFLFAEDNKNVQELTFDKERHAFCNKSGAMVAEDVLTMVVLSETMDKEIYFEIKNIQVDSDLETLVNPTLTNISDALKMLEDL